MHQFIPAEGLHVLLDYAEPGAPFITTRVHVYQNTVTHVVVAEGTRTDFASVPWFFRRLFPQVGPYSRATLFHDVMYRDATATRAQADAIFLAIMKHDGVPWWPRTPIYLAVRYFGWIPWNRRHGGPRRKRWQRLPEEAYLAFAVAIIATLWLVLSSVASGQSCPIGQPCPYPTPYQSPQQWQPLPPQAPAPTVARVFVGNAAGSGSIVASDDQRSYTLTCWHVVKEGGQVSVRIAGSSYAGKVAASDTANDLALIVTQRIPIEPLQVGGEPFGQLRVRGFGRGSYRESTGSFVGRKLPKGATEPAIVISTPARQGDSGGPVVDSQGRLVGVVWGSRGSRSYATPAGPIRRLLSRVFGNNPPPRGPPTTPAACDCGDRWSKFSAYQSEATEALRGITNRLDALEFATPTRDELAEISGQAQEAIDVAAEAKAESQSLLGRAVAAAKTKAGEVAANRLSKLDLEGGLSSAGWALAGALGITGPIGLVAAFLMRRVGRRLENRIDRRLSNRGREVRGDDWFPG